MKDINITDYTGKKVTGRWNEKTYSCKIPGRDDLMRIYVDGEEVHISQEEYSNVLGNIEKEKRRLNREKIEKFFFDAKSMDEEQKMEILLEALEMAPMGGDFKDVSKVMNAAIKTLKSIRKEKKENA